MTRKPGQPRDIMIANFLALDILPGPMGKPLPGITATIVRRSANGALEQVAVLVFGRLLQQP